MLCLQNYPIQDPQRLEVIIEIDETYVQIGLIELNGSPEENT